MRRSERGERRAPPRAPSRRPLVRAGPPIVAGRSRSTARGQPGRAAARGARRRTAAPRRAASRTSASWPVSRALPNGSSLERSTATSKKRLAKPLASSVAVRYRSSSSLVMCPTIPTCAARARSGLLRTIVCSALPSHAWRTIGESVFPSRERTFRTCANSCSSTSRRLSAGASVSVVIDGRRGPGRSGPRRN